MKKIILVLLTLVVIAFGIMFLNKESDDLEWDDSDYYTELNFEIGSEEFNKSARFLQLSNEMIEGNKTYFFIYERQNQKELHAIIKDENGNCTSIHAREIPSENSIFRQVSYNDSDTESVQHTCSGQYCSSCRFRRNFFTGEITGCRCSGGWGKSMCNHTISIIIEESSEDSELEIED